MFDRCILSRTKCHIFSTISFLLIIFLILFADTIISNFSLHLAASQSKNIPPPAFQTPHLLHRSLESRFKRQPLLSVKEGEDFHDHGVLLPALNLTTQARISWLKQKLPVLQMFFEPTKLAAQFNLRVAEFLGSRQCKARFFNTWISPAENFGERELYGLESLFKAHPDGCLIIISRTMDTASGQTILKPLLDQGYRVLAVTPDLSFLFNNTPAEAWLNDIKSGNKDPGRIPLAQNLSNLVRLAILYKYGGVYLDTDFIILKNLSGMRNSIGAQSADLNGNWKRLNNAVLIFDKNHPLVFKFIEEFANGFDGNRWGHNGPYLVSRVVQRVALAEELNFTILPPIAFYPADWRQIPAFFTRPKDALQARWMNAKMIQLDRECYGVHLWNRESKRLIIEEGSIMSRLISDHCVVCNHTVHTC